MNADGRRKDRAHDRNGDLPDLQLPQPMGVGLRGAWSMKPAPILLTEYQGNLERILTSIRIAKERGATMRVGPELEIPCVVVLCRHFRKLRRCTEDTDATITSSRVGLPRIPRPHIFIISRRHRTPLLGSASEDPLLRRYGWNRVRHWHVRCLSPPHSPSLMTPTKGP